ncbi:hypothetical protein CKY02_12055 [Photorhabdus bodei]|uniref:Uncharacterized protein n=1 Tax=Photorhabdus bodei TaxID=2029681 RepID=A0A329X5K8_9GAMM|nr:hypothetical protein CKY02_12055 [Photorhabdus bodei]
MNGRMLSETNLFQIEHGPTMEWATVIFITTPLRDKSYFHIGRVWFVFIVQGALMTATPKIIGSFPCKKVAD